MKASLILFPKISVHLKRLNVLGKYKKCIQHLNYSLLYVHLKRLIIVNRVNLFILVNSISYQFFFFFESIMIAFNMLIIINNW